MIKSIINLAEQYGLTKWDYAAIVISIVSIVIAYKTLKSQIMTQKNTRLLLSQNAGYEYLKSYIATVIISYMHLSILDTIIKKEHIKNNIICDYNPLFFVELSLPLDGIRPDHFISYPIVYNLLNKVNSFIYKYNEFVDFIKRRILEDSIKVQIMSEKELTPYTHIDEAQNHLKQITRDLIHTIKIIKSKNEKEGEELSQDDIASLLSEIDAQVLDSFTSINNNRNIKPVHSKELDECLFDDSILETINDSNKKKTVSSIYYNFCRDLFDKRGDYFVFRKNTRPTKREMIVDEIRALFFKGEADKAFCKINDFYVEDINNIGRHTLLTFKDEDIQNAFFKKELRRIREFYNFLYECINSSAPQSLEGVDFEKWNSFNAYGEAGPWTPHYVHLSDVHLSGYSLKIIK